MVQSKCSSNSFLTKLLRLSPSHLLTSYIYIFTILQPSSFAQLIRDRSVSCNSNSMEVSFEFAQPFTGYVYASKYSQVEACSWTGNGSRRLVASIPLNTNPSTTPYCGVQLKEDTGEFNVLLIITPMKGILVDGMVGLTVRCLYNIGDVTLSLPAGPNGSGIFIRYNDSPQSQAGVVTGSGGSPFLQMAIRDGHGINGEIVQAATVGQRITLDIVMQDTTIYDFYVHDCYAHDGTNTDDASISIIDTNGCAVRLSRAVDVPVMDMPSSGPGSAKHVYIHMYGFQFTTSQLVYFECQVRPCLQSCNRPQCNSSLRQRRSAMINSHESQRVERVSGIELPVEKEEVDDNYNLTAVIRIEGQKIVNVIPAAQDASIKRAGRGELCLHVSVAIGILCMFVLVCIVSLIIAIFICHRAHNESKHSTTYYTPASTPTNNTPSPAATHFRNNRHRLINDHSASYPASSY